MEIIESKLIKRWNKLTHQLEIPNSKIDYWWKNIIKYYSNKNRAYHNLIHLENMFQELDKYSENIEYIECISFSIFFHDIIYKSLKKDNEEKSAAVAIRVLSEFGYNDKIIQKCKQQILSTKKHEPLDVNDKDCPFLIDFDLEILSRNWEEYELYTRQIRKEYKMVPNLLYRNGRKKAMMHFLEREYIYQTEFYREKKEEKARKNILREIEMLE